MSNHVGEIVYDFYNPSKLGVVTLVEPSKYAPEIPVFTVRWLTGKHAGTTATHIRWNSFEALVEEHERKAKKHRDTLTKVQTQLLS